MPVGALAQLVQTLQQSNDANLLVGPENGSDAGVYKLRDDLLMVQSLDFFPPLVDDPFVFGQIAAANSLSDVYAMGAQPTTALNIVGFPDDRLELDILEKILQGGSERVLKSGAVVAGGHTVRDTEIKYGLSVTGVASPEQLMTNRDARAGDVLVLTKGLGTGFITTAFKAGRCDDEVLQAAVASMTQLNSIGRDAAVAAGVRGSTDITGFGLAGHAIEMAQASCATLVLEAGKLPILPGAEELADRGYKTRASDSNRQFAEETMRIEGQVDPLRLEMIFDAQTSGGLLLSVPADQADAVVTSARAAGAKVACIVGQVVEREGDALVVRP